ncbi:hypothetical protein NUW58_g9106 [Xylaria curta]|uniref:Uncharacterized protein n=1 Tax=Xylaria curta TaxID=42375 RepID=A0ACC1N2F5_9PEZI|nr:hypothetical protein NUW58_g9106 [Xylaria curta]
MGVASGITHLIESIVEMIQGIFATIAHMFEFVFSSIVGVFRALMNFVEGTLGFAIREFPSLFSVNYNPTPGHRYFSVYNFFILGTVAAVILGYTLYTQRKGTAPASRAVKN